MPAGNFDHVPLNIRARLERSLIEAERTLAAAEGELDVVSGRRVVLFTIRLGQIAVPTVLSAVAVTVQELTEHARTHLWSATELRVAVENDVLTGAARHLFDAFRLRETSFDSFNTEVSREKRTAAWWPAYQAVIEERSGIAVTLGAQLHALYKETGWTVETLAEKIGIDRKSVFRHFNGEAQPKPETLKTYEHVFSEQLKRPIVLAY